MLAAIRLAARNLRWRLIEWLERPDVRSLTGEQLIYRVMGWQSHRRPKAIVPNGFQSHADGIYNAVIRSEDGAGLLELHESGECPRDCPICQGDEQ